MQNSIIERISGGGYLKRLSSSFLAYFFRVTKNIALKQERKHQLHLLQNHYMILSYKLLSASDYCKKLNINEISYNISTSKVYIFHNFYINVFKECSLMRDSNMFVLTDAFPHRRNMPNFVDEEFMKIDTKKPCICIDEAVNLALKWETNYWHFTFSVLGKLVAFEENGFSGKYILFDKPFIRELVKFIGIGEDKIVFVQENDCLFVKNLHVVEDYAKCDYSHLQKIKGRLLDKINVSDTKNYPKRLYIRRIGKYNRQVENESEILELLKKYGFEAIFPDDYSVAEQIKYFHAADIIVCPHGGCSTNALYMRPDTHFVECFSYTYINPCMLDTIQPNGIYYHMISESVLSRADKSGNFRINPLLLEDTVYKYVEEPVNV